MIYVLYLLSLCLCTFLSSGFAQAKPGNITNKAEETMLRATKFMVENVSTNGGYVWYYTTDLSRRWGEMEAFKTMVWVQDGGTVSMGYTFLDAYRATGNEYFYQAAKKAASALIQGQSKDGGWNYMIDFDGESSLKHWYNTIGKNGWRLEEFQHYYGNDTYDDDVTSDAARFLLKMYLQKREPEFKVALDKALNFILKSQYPEGGWPQRFPLKAKADGQLDYSSYFTFNDGVIWENVHFLIQCYQMLGEERFLDPISRGMNFFLLSQQKNGAWGQQYNLKLEPASARSYEPAALMPGTTLENSFLLLKFYQYTGDEKYLKPIPKAIEWLEKVRLPKGMSSGGRYTHPVNVEIGTDKPLFVHRKGSNVKYGYYYTDYSDTSLLIHMFGKRSLNIAGLKAEFDRVKSLSPREVTAASPQKYLNLNNEVPDEVLRSLSRGSTQPEEPQEQEVLKIISELDNQHRWLAKHVMISNPYIGDGQNKDPTNVYASTHVGDHTDTSPYRDTGDTPYISTSEYIRNMKKLISFINRAKAYKF